MLVFFSDISIIYFILVEKLTKYAKIQSSIVHVSCTNWQVCNFATFLIITL
jgi:hypothetical protein